MAAPPGKRKAQAMKLDAEAAARVAGVQIVGVFAVGASNVLVFDEDHIRKLYSLHCPGSSASTSSLKPLFIRGKRRRFRDLDALSSHVEPWRLTLMEAMYMLARDEISIVGTDRAPLNVAEAWALFKESSCFASPRQFACNYAAYANLRGKGWVVKMGQTYGCIYTLYQGDPDFFHSQFCVLLRDVDGQERWDWIAATREMRVASQTSKEAMLCDVRLTEEPDTPLCAAEVEFVILLRWSLRHEEKGKERQPHRRLRRRLLAPALKRAKQDSPSEDAETKKAGTSSVEVESSGESSSIKSAPETPVITLKP